MEYIAYKCTEGEGEGREIEFCLNQYAEVSKFYISISFSISIHMCISVYLATYTLHIDVHTSRYGIHVLTLYAAYAIGFLGKAKKFRRLKSKINFLAHIHAGVHTFLTVSQLR